MHHTAPAPRAPFVCLVLCLSLLAQALLPAHAGASADRAAVDTASTAGVRAARSQPAEAEDADLPDLNEVRSRPLHEPKAVPPVPSTRRRCPPRNPRCDEDVDGRGRPAPTPTPRDAAQAGTGDNLLASFTGRSLMTLMTAALSGGRVLMDVGALDFYTGGGSSVSDSGPAPAWPVRPGYAAAPAPLFQNNDSPQPFVTGMSLGAMRADSPGWTGFKMTTGAQPFTLTSLGRLCSSGNSLLHELRLIRASDNVVLASTGVSMSGCVVNQFRYESLSSPVTLAANTAYLVVSYEVGADLFHDWTGTALTTTPVATVNHGVYTTNGGQTWGPAGSTGNSYVPLGFEYTPGTPSVSFVTGRVVGAMRADSPGWTGFKMTTGATPLSVSSLGRLCLPGNSLSHDLKLIRSSDNTAVATATVAMGGCTEGQFKYAPLASAVTLAANTAYLVVSYEAGSDLFHDWSGTALTTTPAATVNHGVYTTNGGQTWGAAGWPGNSYVPLDFKYQTDEQGTGTGLTAKYYGDLDFNSYRLTRSDASVNFNWGGGAPAASMGADQFSVRWAGMVSPRYTQNYTFYTTTDDGVRLWVDQKLIIDKWVDQGPTQWSGQVALEAGRLYDIRMEFYENVGGASAKLEWQSASQAREVVPQSRLYGCWKAIGEFVKDFYQAALARQPSAAELSDWSNRLAQAQGETQLLEEARALGVALFDLSPSSAYTARGRSNADFVADLYRGYLQRDPDQAGWDYWLGRVGEGRVTIRAAFEQSPEFFEKVRRLCGTSAAADANAGAGYNFSSARLDPANRTGGDGVDPYSRNYNFSIPLVSLAGRAGLDLGLVLSYNSLVWTKDANAVTFDADEGFPSPGFRLGFPVIQPKFVNPQLQQAGQPVRHSYLLLTPAGARVELRQVGTSNVYESADSSYLQLTEGVGLTLRSTDGSQLTFYMLGGSYRCHEARDRNGNYISAAYWGDGRIQKVTDTLGRTLTFNYDNYLNLNSITQPWRRETEAQPNPTQDEQHVWASFGYENRTLQPQFSNLAVVGEQPGAVVPVVNQVGLPDGSYYRFEYNGWGQVWKATRYAADAVDANHQPNFSHALTSTWLDLPGAGASVGGAAPVPAAPQTDSPRFTQERTWVEKGLMNADGEAATSYSPWAPNMASCEVTLPNGVREVTNYATSADPWKKGLITSSEVRSGGQTMRTTALTWEHDGGAGATYATNPRVTQTTVSDPQGNARTTRVEYTTPADFQTPGDFTGTLNLRLPKKVEECTAGCSTVLRTTVTDYKIPSLGEYVPRRILALARFRYVYEGVAAGSNLRSQAGYLYDEPNTTQDAFLAASPSPAAQHDGGYGQGFRWRGNANRVRRYEVNQQTGAVGGYLEKRAGYNVTGTVAYRKDAAGHKTSVGYADSFFLSINRTHPDPQHRLQTLAYPTVVTDPDGFTSTVSYNYDMGFVRQTQTPLPNVTLNQPGPLGRRYYDAAGRIVKSLTVDNGAYTEWLYAARMDVVQSYTTLDSVKKAYSAQLLDGAGRARAASRYLPPPEDAGAGPYAGNYAGQKFDYDEMGRVARQTSPAEVTAAWQPAGEDPGGWVYTRQSYDWKGRPLVTTRDADGTTFERKYGGCGCAGGEVTTVRDEAGRRQRTTYDVLGRVWKTQVLFQQDKSQPFTDSPTEAVYSTETNTYNALDQLTEVKAQEGASGDAQHTTLSYDGYGRLASKHTPSQVAGASTTYTYNADDSLETATDARGARTVVGYNNNRGLVTSVAYDLEDLRPGENVSAAGNVTLTYDAAGNRTRMTDGHGAVDYQYDVLSRLRNETRVFSDPVNSSINGVSQSITYDYNLANQLQSVTDPSGHLVSYTYGRAGQLTAVGGSPSYGGASSYVSGMKYRAWGGVRAMSYGNGRSLTVTYNNRQQVESFQIPGVLSSHYRFTTTPTSQDNDGLVKFAQDLTQTNSPFDRSYAYDDIGRLTEARTGSRARGGSLIDGPYHENLGYDVWGHMTSRSGDHWGQPIEGYSTEYTNDREPSTTYDADGRPIGVGTLGTTYDAAGRRAQVLDTAPRARFQAGLTVTQGHDGDGQRVKHKENSTTTYYVRSSVLGAVVAELSGTGGWKRGYVYDSAGGLLATRAAGAVQWLHTDPVTGNERRTNLSGADVGGVEVNPLGIDVGRVSPYDGGGYDGNYLGGEGGLMTPPRYSDMLNGQSGCTIDGAAASCDQATGMPEGSYKVLPDGVSTINVKWDHKTGDLEIRGTNKVIMDNGAVVTRKWVDTGGQRDPHHHDNPDDGVIRIFTDIKNTGHWEYSVSQGMVGPDPCAVDTQLPAEGAGYVIKSNTSRTKQFGTRATIENLQRLAADWAHLEAIPRLLQAEVTKIDPWAIELKLPPSKLSPLRIGDIGQAGGGQFPPHKGPGHPAGVGVDIGLFRTDKKNAGTTYTGAQYDRATTQDFVNLLDIYPGVEDYYFNDPEVTGTKLRRVAGHDNHIHVNFKPCAP